ncbi:uncharacterized protein METZ01_LOCUS204165, partial [marine metagenome]
MGESLSSQVLLQPDVYHQEQFELYNWHLRM